MRQGKNREERGASRNHFVSMKGTEGIMFVPMWISNHFFAQVLPYVQTGVSALNDVATARLSVAT